MTILPTDKGFKSTNCGTWTDDLSPITRDRSSFGDGTYIVGVDMLAGTYRSSGQTGCYWERVKDFTGSGADSILANDNTDTAAIVTISPTDKGFGSKNCGTWTRIGDASSSSPAPTSAGIAAPSSNPPPTSAGSGSSSSPQSAVEDAVTAFGTDFQVAARTSDCSAMVNVATGDALAKEQEVCTLDSQSNVHKEITNLSPSVVESVTVSPDGSSATEVVTKHQDILFVHNDTGKPDDQDPAVPSGSVHTQRDVSYTATYYLISTGGRWLVSSFAST
ncbi:MAG: ARC6/PARC6 family protein [Chloroflexota bacterium]|nr:ARC6/PARC6 family protein [Chloroflexota bacterium]